MKFLALTFFMLLGLWGMGLSQACAQDNDAPATRKVKKKKKAKGSLSPVAAALAEAGYFTETEANPKARVYIFLCSASWCPPCRKLMPQIVEEYNKNMKKNRAVSLILVGYDSDEESARKYLEHYEMDIPGIHKSKIADALENAPQLKGIPSCFFMNAKGELISSGYGAMVLNWKNEMKKRPEKKK